MRRPSFRMLTPIVMVSSIAIAVVASSACSSSSNTTPFTPGTQGSSSGAPANATWCTGPAATACKAVDVCGVCVPSPPAAPVKRTSDTREYAGSGPPDVSCFDKGKAHAYDPKSTQMATMRGYARIFANGPDSQNVKIEVYKEALDGKGMPTGKLGDLVGSTVSDKTLPAGTKQETIYKAGKPETRTLYPYELKNVPTETPLIFKTSGSTPDAGWFALYDFNQIAYNSDLVAGVWTVDVRALGNDDYSLIIRAAYTRPPVGGQGAIAGEVHDCGDVRLSNATVGISPATGLGLFYLSETEDDPLPDQKLVSSAKLGLYAEGGFDPGVYQVAAAGTVGTTVYALGSYPVQAFADSVSVFTFRGVRPWQIAH